MPETIEIYEDLEIIQIRSFDSVTSEDLERSRQLVSQICQERGFSKILVDTTAVTSLPPTISLFEHGVNLSKIMFPLKRSLLLLLPNQ